MPDVRGYSGMESAATITGCLAVAAGSCYQIHGSGRAACHWKGRPLFYLTMADIALGLGFAYFTSCGSCF